MTFTAFRLLTASALVFSLGFGVAGAQEEDADMSIQLKGTPVVYIQKKRSDVLELRGDRANPDFMERSWASTQQRERAQAAQDRERQKQQSVARKGLPSDVKKPGIRTKKLVAKQKRRRDRAPAGFGPVVKVTGLKVSGSSVGKKPADRLSD